MIQRDERFNAVLQQLIDDVIVESDPLLIHCSVAIRYDPCPCDREPVDLQSQFLHHGNVFFVMMVEV